MIGNNEPAKSAEVFNLQHLMERAISEFVRHPLTAVMSLDDIYKTARDLPESQAYVGESLSPTRKYIVRIAISNALRAWIDNKGTEEARKLQELRDNYTPPIATGE